MKIGICNDHAGVEYKNRLVEYLTGKGYQMVNFGTDTTDSMDYPDAAHPLALAVENGEVDILVMPARFIPFESVIEITDAWLSEEFEGGRHQKRIDKIPYK